MRLSLFALLAVTVTGVGYVSGGDGSSVPTSDLPVDTLHIPCTGDEGADGTVLRTAIQGTRTGVIRLADGCTYRIGPQYGPSTDAIVIENAEDLTIAGHGVGRSRIQLTRDVFLGFKVVGNINGLTIKDLTIAGAITERDPRNFCGGTFPLLESPDKSCNGYCPDRRTGTTPNTHAIATSGPSVRNVTYTGLEIHSVAVGISSGGACDGSSTCSDVTIQDNYIHDIHGTCPGSGYGITTNCTRNLVIQGNTVRRTERHAIYQAETQLPHASEKGDNVLIRDNVIIEHRHGTFHEGPAWYKVALVIARSNYVTAINNLIVHSRETPISVEKNEHTGAHVEHVYVINNRILGPVDGSARGDVYLDAGGDSPIVMWFNRRNETQPARIHVNSGVQAPLTSWDGTQWIEAAAGDAHLYVMRRDTLHRVTPDYATHPDSWRHVKSTTSWAGFQSMATTRDGYVYVMRGNILHRVVPEARTGWWWHWYSLRNWSGVQGMAAHDGRLYVMQNGCLHKVTARNVNADWELESACGWSPFAAMRGEDRYLWMYRSGSRVDEVDANMNVVDPVP